MTHSPTPWTMYALDTSGGHKFNSVTGAPLPQAKPSIFIDDANGNSVALVNRGTNRSDEEFEANKNLILAAPEMLALLKQLEEQPGQFLPRDLITELLTARGLK